MSDKPYQRSIWWIKRDIRLTDNDALTAAIASSQSVLPLYIAEPSVLQADDASRFHIDAISDALADLATKLKTLGVELAVTTAEVVPTLTQLLDEDGFDAIYSHEETGVDLTFQRDKAVAAWCEHHGIRWHEYPQNGVVRGLKSRDTRQGIIKERLFDTAPKPCPAPFLSWLPQTLPTQSLPDNDRLSPIVLPQDPTLVQLQRVGESQADADLTSFLTHRGYAYSGGISSPNTAFTAGSRLSTHLAWGTVSIRTVFHRSQHRINELSERKDREAMQWRKSLRAFQSRLHWHDHFIQRLESFPVMETQAINPAYQHLGYADDETILQAWHTGTTGIPMLDACMRCLLHTGFLNFRMRAMPVTTACFGLRQSWQSIHGPLARVFLDYEPGIHLSQIQMQAGIVGINTLRVYSPHKQLLDQDPDCTFIKRWIPELQEFPAETIALYESISLGDYPRPIADIKANAKLIKDQIQVIRKSEEGRTASSAVLEAHGSRRPQPKRTPRRTSKRTTQSTPKSTPSRAIRGTTEGTPQKTSTTAQKTTGKKKTSAASKRRSQLSGTKHEAENESAQLNLKL